MLLETNKTVKLAYFFSCKPMIPRRAIKKVNIPKEGGSKPIINPKKNQTSANKLKELISFIFFPVVSPLRFIQEKTIITRETINNIEAKLPNNTFLRIHKSYIINLNKVESYTKELVGIRKKVLPISRTYKENVLKKLG